LDNVPDIAVYDLNKDNRTIVYIHVKGLCFDAGSIRGQPLLVLFGEDSVWCSFSFLRDGLDSLGAVFGFLCTSNGSKAAGRIKLVLTLTEDPQNK
jgi:hypothetical protein